MRHEEGWKTGSAQEHREQRRKFVVGQVKVFGFYIKHNRKSLKDFNEGNFMFLRNCSHCPYQGNDE